MPTINLNYEIIKRSSPGGLKMIMVENGLSFLLWVKRHKFELEPTPYIFICIDYLVLYQCFALLRTTNGEG